MKDRDSNRQEKLSTGADAISKAIHRERELEHRVNHLVGLLMDTLNIPEDDRFVSCFGTGGERDNREALTTWVRQMLLQLDADGIEAHWPEICERLQRRMDAVRAGQGRD